MTFGSRGYEPVPLHPNRYVPTAESEFCQVRTHCRANLPEHQHERFITDFYEVVLEQPRDYSRLIQKVKNQAEARRYSLPDTDDISKLCKQLHDEVGNDIEISGLWYINYMKVFTCALRACSPTQCIVYNT